MYAIRDSRNASSSMARDSGATNTSMAFTVLASCEMVLEPNTTIRSQCAVPAADCEGARSSTADWTAV